MFSTLCPVSMSFGFETSPTASERGRFIARIVRIPLNYNSMEFERICGNQHYRGGKFTLNLLVVLTHKDSWLPNLKKTIYASL